MSVCLSVGPSTRWFPDDNSRTLGARIMKLHRYIDHDWQMTPIDFQVTRSKVKVTEFCETVAPCMVRERTMSVGKKDIGISKGTQHYTVISTCRVLSAIMEQYIRFPESRHELKIIAYGFHE
ncbi:hypothetical protein DPMN_144845 [Dreissena polymorpha]|uniref:Uncharacterized protein n=1 Tax=Dreissena polymorpha TaxID=45954 RepID=A0A9D4IWY2_DREPO|nr:hypothetical protein DPMN_144845 [Dreissena polymorpha]